MGCKGCEHEGECGPEVNPHNMGKEQLEDLENALQMVVLKGSHCTQKIHSLLGTISKRLAYFSRRQTGIENSKPARNKPGKFRVRDQG